MRGYYYKILDKIDDKLITEDIVNDDDSVIHPLDKVRGIEDYEDFPEQCEARNFRSINAILKGFYFDIPFYVIESFKINSPYTG